METVLIRIRKDDRDKLKSLAERDGRTVVSFLHRLIGEPSPVKVAQDDKLETEYKQYAASLSGLPNLTRSSRLATWCKEHNYEPSAD